MNFNNLRIGKKLYLSFGIVIILILAVLCYTNSNFSDQSKAVKINLNTYEILSETTGIFTSLLNMETGVQGFVLTGNDAFLEPFNSGKSEYKEHFSKIKELTLNPKQQERLALLQQNIQEWEAKQAAPLIDMRRRDTNMEYIARYIQTGFGKKNMDEMRNLLAEIDAEERVLLEQRSRDLQDRENNTRKAMLFGGLAAIGLAAFLAFFITRIITRPVNVLKRELTQLAQNGGDLTQTICIDTMDEIGDLARAMNCFLADLRRIMSQVLACAENLAASTQQLTASAHQSAVAANRVVGVIEEVACGADEQVNLVNATSGIIEQMSESIQQVATHANNVATTSENTAAAAKAGGQAINNAIRQMASINKTVINSSQVVAKLGERSNEIGQIVAAISSIAGQTNLLALNAAIEAARAGDAGRGFAVVAEEVRKLAEQSGDAAKQISKLISAIQNDTTSAVEAMNNGTYEVKIGTEVVNMAGLSFQEITSLVDEVSSQIHEISSSTQQMVSGSQQIVSSAHDIQIVSKDAAVQTQTISRASEEQSQAMEEIAASSQVLAELAEQLTKTVGKFRV